MQPDFVCVPLFVWWYDSSRIGGRTFGPAQSGGNDTLCIVYQRENLEFRISDGKATVKGWVTGQTGVADRCKVVAYLQEKSGTTWKTVATWTDESDGLRASVSKSKSVTAGKTYRAKAVVTAWSGSDSESATIYSSEETA